MLIVRTHPVLRVKFPPLQQRRRIETCLVARKIAVTGKIIEHRVGLHHCPGQLLTNIPVENIRRVPLPIPWNRLVRIPVPHYLVPDQRQYLVVIKAVSTV